MEIYLFAVYRVPRQQGTAFVASLSVMPRVYTRVVAAQQEDQQIQRVLHLPEVSYGEDGTVRYRNRLYVPSAARQELCDEVHRSKLSIHPSGNKMYQNVKRHFDEERDCRVCIQMSDLPAGESRTSEASRVTSAIADS